MLKKASPPYPLRADGAGGSRAGPAWLLSGSRLADDIAVVGAGGIQPEDGLATRFDLPRQTCRGSSQVETRAETLVTQHQPLEGSPQKGALALAPSLHGCKPALQGLSFFGKLFSRHLCTASFTQSFNGVGNCSHRFQAKQETKGSKVSRMFEFQTLQRVADRLERTPHFGP